MSDGQKETASDFGSDEAAKARRWIAELSMAEKAREKYLKRCEKILTRYEDYREGEAEGGRKFNIFWSNTETLKPACYARVPRALVGRRNNDADQVARIAGEVLERCINYANETYDFDQVLKDVRDEFLLIAQGTTWARYIPTFEKAVQTEGVEQGDSEDEPAGPMRKGVAGFLDKAKSMLGMGGADQAQAEQPAERLTYEQVVCDHVSYEDWGANKCRKWGEVRFVWRRAYLGRDALKKRFGEELGALIPLDRKLPDGSSEQDQELFGQATIYEIWDKPSRTAIWVCKLYSTKLLDERPDPLGLEDFFPCPKPAFGTLSPRSIIPIPDYAQYQDQAEELDEVTARVSMLTKALRVVGLYAGEEKTTLQNMLKPGAENQMIPVDTWAVWADKGGVKGLVDWFPVDMVMEVLDGLYTARERLIHIIYQICAIPDIMRGDTDPDETAAAQGYKVTWGNQRVREKQKEMARFCRDDMRIKGQVIAKKFSLETIKAMSNMQLLTREEKAQIGMAMKLHAQSQQAAQAMQVPGAPPQPPAPPPFPQDKLALMEKPAWEDIDELLKSDFRNFRIDIETDSTVEPDLMMDKRDAAEYLTAVGGIIQNTMEAVKAAPPLGKVVAEAVKQTTRKYKMGREMEDVVEKAMDEIAAGPPPPVEGANTGMTPEEMQLEQAKVQSANDKNQIARDQMRVDEANSQRDAQTNAASAQAEMDRVAMEERNARMDKMMDRMLAFLDSQTRIEEAHIDADTRRYEADRSAEAVKSKPTNGLGKQ